MRLIFCCLQYNLQLKSCPERSGEAKTDVRKKFPKNMFLKRHVCQHFASLNAGKRHFVYLFLIQNTIFCLQKDVSAFCWILAKSWQTSPPGKMFANIPLPNQGGWISHIFEWQMIFPKQIINFLGAKSYNRTKNRIYEPNVYFLFKSYFRKNKCKNTFSNMFIYGKWYWIT